MKLSKKVVLIGHFGVGKTSLFRRFIDNAFSEDYKSTLGVQIQKKTLELSDDTKLSMIIWDTEGHASIEDNRTSYLLGSNAFIYVFDLTRKDTYENITDEIAFLEQNYSKSIIKIVGNKLDAVDRPKTIELLKKQEISYDYLTSAKTSKNVEKLFRQLAEDLAKK